MDKKKELDKRIEQLLHESTELKVQAVTHLLNKGEVLDLETKWYTQEEYCSRFGIASVQTIQGWIDEGTIPPENIRFIPELNGLRLIKGVPYQIE